jgi:hypothetical protein
MISYKSSIACGGNPFLYLDPEIDQLTLNVSTVAEWGGQGASYILTSTTYNGRGHTCSCFQHG